ncbi:PD-(D/E)XK nuclease family protein [Pyrobaculum aerophilum]|uniref:PD-(D/E)XK nuclease family protein n=1 Tax=Pyrobaculum aerophilum TaxID=13773 RepID=UPI002FDA70CE
MSLVEEIRRVLIENPDILVDVLVSRPEIVYKALAKLVPWQNLATKQDVGELRKEVEVTKEELKREIRQISVKLDALGARWGVLGEDAFREGVRELLREVGYKVERWLYYDADGHVYGYPSEVELDIVIKDGVVIAVEITSSLKRGDLYIVKRKTELYTKASGRLVNAVLIITPYINDKNPNYVKVMAERIGIKLVTPEEAAEKPL